MNKAAVQEIYDRLNQPRDIDFIKGLGFKSCVFYDLFGIASVVDMSDTDLCIRVEQQLESLCRYALNGLQKDVFSKLETVLESLTEAQKD